MWVELTRLSRHRQTFTQHSCRFIKMSTCNTIMHFRSSFLCVCECVWWQPSCVFLWTTISHSTGQTNCWWRLRSGLQTAKSCSTFRSFVLDGSLQGQLHACSPERLTAPEVGERSTITCSLVRLLPCVLLTKEVAPWTVLDPGATCLCSFTLPSHRCGSVWTSLPVRRIHGARTWFCSIWIQRWITADVVWTFWY